MTGVLSTHLPNPKQVRDLLAELVDREVTLGPSTPFVPGPAAPASVAVYVDDRLQITALISCDVSLSAYAASALALIPIGVAEEAIENQALDQGLAESLYEVLNIAASMFNMPNSSHLKLHSVYPAGAPLDPNIRMRTMTLGRREDLEVTIAGYGTGRFSIVVVA